MKPEQLYLKLAAAIRDADTNPPCQETDPEAWFLDKSDVATSRQAKELCESCPVIKECGEFAIANQEQFGIWGGMTPRERSFYRLKGRRGLKPGQRRVRQPHL
jgi:WhiB family redox-sensing transcriptional regulator